ELVGEAGGEAAGATLGAPAGATLGAPAGATVGATVGNATSRRRPAEDDLVTRRVPAGAVLLDCRPEPLRSAWEAPGHQVLVGPSTAAERERLDPDGTYVCFCLHGTRSRWVAERLRADGFRAFAFGGGMTALTRWLAEATDADEAAGARTTVTAAGGA